jgi:hypothetical protein
MWLAFEEAGGSHNMREVKLDAESLWPGCGGPYEYALLVDSLDCGRFEMESYGVRVSCPGTGEEARVENVTVSAERIDALCELLARNQVGPVHLREVVDDWL